ncbi:MAG: DUF4040 domain-containing protein [Candidatus Dormibacteraeota bacterium]|nr:DUF4040 domain-containing protein [Candidatus Dormibacteraeota bacterium]
MTPLEVVVYLVVGFGGTAVVLTRDPLRQAMSAGIFGLALVLLFAVYQAPDVALSMLTVAAVALPMMVLIAIARTRRAR